MSAFVFAGTIPPHENLNVSEERRCKCQVTDSILIKHFIPLFKSERNIIMLTLDWIMVNLFFPEMFQGLRFQL